MTEQVGKRRKDRRERMDAHESPAELSTGAGLIIMAEKNSTS